MKESKGNEAMAAKVWKRLHPYKLRIFGSLALLLFAVPLINFHPLVWGIVADDLIEGTLNLSTLLLWLAIMFATYIFGVGANAWHTYLLEKTGQAFVRDIRSDLFRKFQGQALGYHRDNSTGELVTRITSDVDAMEQSVLQGITKLIEEVVTFVVVAGMVLWLSPLVGSLSILPLALAFLFIRIYNRKVKAIYEGVRKKLGNIGSFVQDRLAGVQITQSFGRESYEQAEFDERADGFFGASVRASRLRNTYFPMVSLFGFLNNIVMLGVGGWLIMRGDGAFTVGALLAYRGFWWRLQSPIRTIAQTSDIIQRARAAAGRVFELLDAPVAVETREGAGDAAGDNLSIEFRDVHFHYVAGKPVLNGVTFKIDSGEFVAVAGSSGSGKSTLLNLIPRFYDVTSGSLFVGGADVRELTLVSLRSSMALVGQENYLFDGTVEENLVYGVPDADEEAVRAASIAANAHEFVSNLPEGYQTHVGQNGVKLSGGQRQRLSLARAFLTRSDLLLLDEPTASVEPESEMLIHEAIQNRTNSGWGTTILVTHHVELLRQAPRILFFDGGKLAGDGTHAVLIESCEEYRDAYVNWEEEAPASIEVKKSEVALS